MHPEQQKDHAPMGFDTQGWPLPEVRSMMIDNFVRSWFQHWIAFFVIFFGSILIVLFATWLVTPTWEGKATVIISPYAAPGATISEATPEVAILSAGQQVRNLTEIVKDRELHDRVVAVTGLGQHLKEVNQDNPKLRMRIKQSMRYFATLRFLFPSAPVNWELKARNDLASAWLVIAPSEGTSTLPLLVYGDHPEWTTKVGDAILSELDKLMNEAYQEQISSQVATYQAMLEAAGQRSAASEAAIVEYRKSIMVYDLAGYAAAAVSSITDLEREQSTIETQLVAVDETISRLDRDLSQYEPYLEIERKGTTLKTEDRASHKIESEISTLKGELAAKKLRFPANSPVIRGLEVQIESLDADLTAAKNDEDKMNPTVSTTEGFDWDPRYKELFNRLLDAQAVLTSQTAKQRGIVQALAAMRDIQVKAIEAETKIARLERLARLDLTEVSSLTSAVRSLEILQAENAAFKGILKISDTTIKNPAKADRPSMTLAILLAFGIALFAALVLPVSYDYLNQTLLSSRQTTTIPGLRVTAIVPKMKGSKMFKSTGS